MSQRPEPLKGIIYQEQGLDYNSAVKESWECAWITVANSFNEMEILNEAIAKLSDI